MAWATPRTFVTGEVVTATILNQDIRDNMTTVGNPPRMKTRRSGTQSLTNNVITALTWDQEFYDTDTMHSTATNTQRGTVNTAGLYECQINLEFAGNATGHRSVHINHSVDLAIAKAQLPVTTAAVAPILHCSCDYQFTAGQYAFTEAWQTSGGALITGFSVWDTFTMRRVSV